MIKRIIEEISTFLDAAVNQLPIIRQRNEIAFEKQKTRTIHILRTRASDPVLPNKDMLPLNVYTISDKEFNRYLDTYFSKKLSKSMSAAATDFIRGTNLLPKIEEYYARRTTRDYR